MTATTIDDMIRNLAREAVSDGSLRGRELVRRLMSVERGARYIDASESTLREMIHDGEVPSIKHGTRVKVDRRDLDEWIERKKREGRP